MGARSDGDDEAPRSRAGKPEPAPLSARDLSLPPPSMRGTRGSLERVVVMEGNIVATFGNVFFQVRRGVLTMETAESMAGALHRHRTLLPRGAMQGLMVLAEPGAAIPTEAVRIRQRLFMTELLKYPNVRVAAVMVGDDVAASLLRSASRGVVRSHPHVRIFDRPESACEWISGDLMKGEPAKQGAAMSASELLAALTEARAVAERELR